jgi:hypothetical protein
MTGYVRKDTTNNIADGNVINAADLDAEFDGVQDAFNASTGHKHDGTAGEGATINALGPTQDVTISAVLVAPKTTNTVDIGSNSLKFKDLFLAGNGSVGGTLAVTGVATFTAQPILSSLTASRAVFSDGSKGLVSNAITGTGNVVMSASPTLTGTIDAAALTASGNVTLSGGTANGVAYLNGSKVVTSGSALTFDGTNFGVGTAASYKLHVSGTGTVSSRTYATDATGDASFFVGNNDGRIAGPLIYGSTKTAYGALGSNETAFYSNSSTTIMSDGASTVIKFAAGGNTEGMRLTSTGLGIGTSSPSTKLDVNGDARIGGTSVSQSLLTIGGGSTSAAMNLRGSTGSAYAWQISSNAFVGSALEFTRSTAIGGTTFSTPSMLLDSSGNLLVGATAPYTAAFTGISVQGLTSGTGNLSLGLNKAGTSQILSGDVLGNIYFYGVDNDITAGNNNIGARIASIATTNWTTDGTTSNAALVFYTHGTTSGAPEERARIDSSGNLLVGTTTSSQKLTVAGALALTANSGTANTSYGTVGLYTGGAIPVTYIQMPSGGAIDFWKTDTGTAVRIDSSGNLLVGTTSVLLAGKISAIGGASENGGAFQTTAAANNYTAIACARNGNVGNVAEWWYAAGTQVGTIAVTASATAYNTSSDYRLKNTIAPMTGALAKVALLKPCTYKWNADGSNGEGFIAHELAQVCPHAVTGEKDAVDAEGNPKYQGIDTSFLVATLTAALQEQQAIIVSLQARLDAANL